MAFIHILRQIPIKTHIFYYNKRLASSAISYSLIDSDFTIDENQFRNVQNQKQILENIRLRDMQAKFSSLFQNDLTNDKLADELINVCRELPNSLHPTWYQGSSEIREIEKFGQKKNDYDFEPLKAESVLFNMNLAYFSDLTVGKLGITGGKRSYVFVGQLAKLSNALSKWTMSKLIKDFDFTPVVIPNLIKSDIIRACGFEPFGDRTQVYSLESSSNTCLAGTAEMPLASLHIGENFVKPEELPRKYCALSRCYRAEAKSAGEMSGLYRVHYFDKVEMFGLCESDYHISDKLLDEFVSIQKILFSELGLHYRVLDMPPNELGQPAYRKFDIEAFMPGRDYWGEVSSASNCTDYQAKRLNITYNKFYYDKANQEIIDMEKSYVHTVNGTACAVPRLIIAIVEQNQTKDGRVHLPKVLHPYMGCEVLESNSK